MSISTAVPVRPRRFKLVRHTDVSGVSGTGVVAEGIEWSDGWVTVHWRGQYPSTVVWPDLDAVIAIHGHNGATAIVWDDGPGGQPLAEAV